MKFTNLPIYEKTKAIIAILDQDRVFRSLAVSELRDLTKRDNRDNKELRKGIWYNVRHDDLPVSVQHKQWQEVTVDSKDPQAIVNDIMASVPSTRDVIVVISGDSGIGKSTIAEELRALIPGSTIWSNGTIFRAITFLYTDQAGDDNRKVNQIMTKAVSSIARSLSIKPNGSITAENCGRTQTIETAQLHQPIIDKHVPHVARYCQGPVIRLTNQFLSHHENEGSMIVEGRKASLTYIDATVYIELKISDRTMLGERRAAQRVLHGLEGLPVQDESVRSLVAKVERDISRDWET